MDPPTLPGAGGEGFGLGGSVRIDLARESTLGTTGDFGWAGAASTWFRIDPREKLAAILFMQHLPMDAAAFSLYSTLVYQALAE
jgi:CubicO group peptidase (beta-lactamase class C family)